MRPSLRHLIAIPAILAVTCAHASCAPALRPATVRGGVEAGSYSSFGIDLYKELLKEKPGVNIFISPASVGFALAMTYNGSAGETRTAMASTLGFPDNSFEAVNVSDSTLISQMNDSIPGVKLSVANSLWARQGLTFMKSFLERNTRYYGAEIETLDFSSPGSPAKINQWVARKTNDKITKIVDKIDGGRHPLPHQRDLLQGNLDEGVRQDSDSGGTLPSHGRRDDLASPDEPIGHVRLFQGGWLPGGAAPLRRRTGSRCTSSSPTRPRASSGFTKGSRAAHGIRGCGVSSPAKGRIVLPRFRLEYQSSLKQSLAALGMGIAFDAGRANFTGMFNAPGANAYVNDVVHKTFVDVNEEGTEAAAVTSVEMRVTSAMEPERPFEMIVNRPFFFAIRDEKTGLILFMGSIVNPE